MILDGAMRVGLIAVIAVCLVLIVVYMFVIPADAKRQVEMPKTVFRPLLGDCPGCKVAEHDNCQSHCPLIDQFVSE